MAGQSTHGPVPSAHGVPASHAANVVEQTFDGAQAPDVHCAAVSHHAPAGRSSSGIGVSVLPIHVSQARVPGVVFRKMIGGKRKAGYSVVHRIDEAAPLIKIFIKHLSEGHFAPAEAVGTNAAVEAPRRPSARRVS